jgi:hypothetical protein
MAFLPFGATPGLFRQAATPVTGFALQNATPAILSWTAPNDGQLHRVLLLASIDVTSAETGGAVGLNFTAPDGTSSPFQPVFAAGLGVNAAAGTALAVMCKAGSTVFFNQTSALSAGAAVVWAEIWGS